MGIIKKYGPVAALVIFFIVATFIANRYEDSIASFIEGRGFLAGAVYFVVIAVTTVIAPLSGIPLMPIVSTALGPFITGCISVAGWSIGSYIIFMVSRWYGTDFISRFISEDHMDKLRKSLPGEKDFWSLLLVRMLIPVDVLSYALSLFTNVKLRTYMITTTIGVIPFAFVLAYVGTLSLWTQIGGVAVGVAVLAIIYFKKQGRLHL